MPAAGARKKFAALRALSLPRRHQAHKLVLLEAMQMASSGLQQAWLEDLDMDDPSTVKEWEMRRTTYRVSEAAYSVRLRNQAPEAFMQESPGTKEDPIYLSMFDWC